jgi:DNA mismatch repair protein MutS
MIDEYFNIYKEKSEEYGEKTAVLMAVGSFWEVYEIDNNVEQIGNAKVLSNVLNMKYANKNGDTTKSSRSYPNFVGFNVPCLNKYLPILLEADYTVVLVNQLESSSEKKGKLVKRGVTAVYSKCLQPLDLNTSSVEEVGSNSFNLVNILLDISQITKTSNKKNASTFRKITSSICCVNNFTNDIQITENTFNFIPNKIEPCLNEIDRILYRYFAKEIHIRIVDSDVNSSDNFHKISHFFKTNYENVKVYRICKSVDCDFFKSNYQNEFLTNVYKHIKFGLIQPIEYLNLQKTQLSISNLIYTINFMSKHDLKYISNLNIPNIVNESNHLILELDTLSQLNIDKGVFNIINHTKTAIGKRYLHSLLCKPFKNPKEIEERYLLNDVFQSIDSNKRDAIAKLLGDIVDFERLHRKMALDVLHPYEFEKLHKCYHVILDIIGIMSSFSQDHLYVFSKILPNDITTNGLYDYINSYKETFNLNEMHKFSLNTTKDEISNYFNKGVISELDIIQEKINTIEEKKEKLRMFYNSKINNECDYIKLVYTDGEGYSFTCTKIRYQMLLSKLKECDDKSYETFKIKQTNSVTKFYTPELTQLSNQLINCRELLNTKINLHYINILSDYYTKYSNLFNVLKTFIEILDITYSNYKCKTKYNYCRPEIVTDENEFENASFLEAKAMRHLIIERLDTGCEYIPNDISLNDKTQGMLLYGLNSSGKSSLLRAIGICVVLSQSGLYVPCSSFKYYPFSTIISQVDLTDNLYAGKSSFITEIAGLKKILQCSGKNTICLGDETLRGTESNSAMGLVASMILKLKNNGTKFFFTSHLHQIPKIQEIVELTNEGSLQIKHLSVLIQNKNIVFERLLKDGPGSDLYGIEVAENIIDDDDFIDTAFKIRNSLIDNKTSALSKKKSVYNKKKIINTCEICNSTKQLETHHISEQKNANEEGFINNKHFHKNEKFNLATLCHDCHLQVTLGKIIVTGYKHSVNGKFLHYYNQDKQDEINC